MQKAASPDTLAVAGDKLKQAREARGMSVPDMAGAVTLSREQVRALEDGGNLPFYTADHKRLALKKYAAALGIPLSELIVDGAAAQDASAASAAPEAVPVSPVPVPVPVPASATPADLRLATAERNARLRRQLLATAVAGAILLALYAKQRGAVEPEPPSAAADAAAADAPLEPLVPAGAAAVAVAQEPASPATAAAAVPAPPAAAQAGSEPCSLPAAADVAAWSPPYQRKPDARLFLVSSKAVDVCVADASGKPVLVSLKPNAGHAFSGEPPYLVRAEGLPAIELYLQGMRVRVPAGAQALRLLPTTVTPPPELAASPAAD